MQSRSHARTPRVVLALCALAPTVGASNVVHAQPPPPPAYGVPRLVSEVSWPSVAPLVPDAIESPRIEHGRDDLLISLGVAFLVGGLVGQLTAAGFDQSASNCVDAGSRRISCDSWSYALVPFAGAALAGSQSFRGMRTSFAMAFVGGILLGAAQIAGLILLLVGVLSDDDSIVSGTATVRVLPQLSDSFAGVSLEVDL